MQKKSGVITLFDRYGNEVHRVRYGTKRTDRKFMKRDHVLVQWMIDYNLTREKMYYQIKPDVFARDLSKISLKPRRFPIRPYLS